MRRDNKGRFIKKALLGTTITLNGKKFNIKPEAQLAYDEYNKLYPGKTFEKWVELYGLSYLTEDKNVNIDGIINSPTADISDVTSSITLNGKNYNVDPKAKFAYEEYKKAYPLKTWEDWLNDYGQHYLKEKSVGMQVDPPKSEGGSNNFSIDKTKLADFLSLARAGLSASVNNKIAKRALAAEKPFLQDVAESHHSIYGDYRAQVLGELAAAKLRNMASKPLTSDGALQQQMMLNAQIKGLEYIDEGNAKDEAMIKLTRELAWEQEKENLQLRQAAAMLNRQAMLMSEKNKANILNSRDSANYSQVVSPLLSGVEQRLRNEGKEQEAYQDYYDDAVVTRNVWNTYNTGLSDIQKELRDVYLKSGSTGVEALKTKDPLKYTSEWNTLYLIMSDEIIRQKAAIKGVNLKYPSSKSQDPFAFWTNKDSIFKKGGTIYKTKLNKRTKDNDRGSKSIESSKKLAINLLEKTIKSLYDYKDIEIITKPKKLRKYQAGGGLPFVGYTPVFATSEAGMPAPAKTKDKDDNKEDLTTKDILELLKDLEGLPIDIEVIQAAMSNFIVSDKSDPLGLDSSSNIASRYMKLLGMIKKAKTNKEWYDKAYDKLKLEGALNEYAVDSTGNFIGMNTSGEFARFTAKQVADGEVGDYLLLTNSNLLDIRAKYPKAAFNYNLIMEAANGVSMETVTEYINKVILGLGSDKNSTQIFGDRSKEVLEGLRLLLLAAQEVGQDLSISDLYEASIFTESQAQLANLALSYIYLTMPTNMKALLFAKTGSQEGAKELIRSLVYSKLHKNTKLEFSPKNKPNEKSSGKTSSKTKEGLELSPAQMLQQGYGERETIVILNATSTGLKMEAITLPITTGSTGLPLGAATLEDVATSLYGGILNFTNASMGGLIIPFEGRRNIAIDGSKIYSMYLPIDLLASVNGHIMPDIDLIDKVNAVNKSIKAENITDINAINAKYEEAGLPVFMNLDGTVRSTYYKRFGVLNGTAIDNAFGKTFVESKYLKELDDEDIINNAIAIMNKGRSKEDLIEYDAESFFNFGGALGDYDKIYQGTIFIPISNDIFAGIAGSGKNITSVEALNLEAELQQELRISTYKNPGVLQ